MFVKNYINWTKHNIQLDDHRKYHLNKLMIKICRLCGDRDETINHIISECSKLAQKEYKTRHDWVGKVIHLELCKKFRFDHTNKWYMHNPAPVLENDTHKPQWDFEVLTDHLISARRPDLINKKKREFSKLSTLLPRLTVEKKLNECEKKDKYLDLARELKKTPKNY